MTKPRLTLKPLSLPAPPKQYDPDHQDAVQRLIEQRLHAVQPQQQRQTVTGAKGGNAALTSLLTALVNLGLITDSTT